MTQANKISTITQEIAIRLASTFRENWNKGFILVTPIDYSFPPCNALKIGSPTVVVIHVKNRQEAIEEVKKIVRKAYEDTNIEHTSALLENGKVIAEITSPDCNDPKNQPLCRFCFEFKGRKVKARYCETYNIRNHNVCQYSCGRHLVDKKFIETIAAVASVEIVDLRENKTIFPKS